MKNSGISYFDSLLVALALMVGGWAVFSLVRLGVDKLLLRFGINSEVTQYVIIIVAVILILLISGYGVKAAIKKLAGN